MAKIDLTSPEWCELIFQGKNKAYGAYKMRANSPKRHTWAMVIVVIIAAIGFSIPTLVKLATPKQKPAFPQPELPEGFKPSRRRLRKCVRKRRTALQQNLPLWRARREAPSEPHRRGDRSACIQAAGRRPPPNAPPKTLSLFQSFARAEDPKP